MLGWFILVSRQVDGGTHPATSSSEHHDAIAGWQADLGGLGWINALVTDSKAIKLGGNGYPFWYTAQAKHVRPSLYPAPPFANPVWACGPSDIITSKWRGKTFLDHEALDQCAPEEWLLIEAWDES